MPERTDWPLDLAAIEERAERAREWTASGTEFVPTSVRTHFEVDVPALLAEVKRLHALRDTSVLFQAAKTAVNRYGLRPDVIEALRAVEARWDEAVLAALEGEPS